MNRTEMIETLECVVPNLEWRTEVWRATQGRNQPEGLEIQMKDNANLRKVLDALKAEEVITNRCHISYDTGLKLFEAMPDLKERFETLPHSSDFFLKEPQQPTAFQTALMAYVFNELGGWPHGTPQHAQLAQAVIDTHRAMVGDAK